MAHQPWRVEVSPCPPGGRRPTLGVLAYTFFGIQVAVASPGGDDLPERLRAVIAAGEARQTLADKRTFWRRVTTAVNTGMPAFTWGYWDLILV
jgi:hypothetical protein